MSRIQQTTRYDGPAAADAGAQRSFNFKKPDIGAANAAAAPGCKWSEQPPDAWDERQNAVGGDKGFLRPSWFSSWTASYGSSKIWRGPTGYLSIESDDRLCGVMPIAFQITRTVCFAAVPGYYMPSRSVVIFENSARTAAQMVAGIGNLPNVDAVRLGPLPRTDTDLAPLLGAFRDAGWRLIEKDLATVFSIQLPNSAEEFERHLPPKRKKRLRYYWKSMCKAADTKIVHYNDLGVDEWCDVFTDLAAIEKAAWVSKSGDPRFMGDQNQMFWSHLTRDPWMRKAMHAWVIYHDGSPVSLCFTIDSGDTRYILANSYDSRVAKFSTGSKIYNDVIVDAIGRGYSTINIGMGDPGYKSRWGAEGSHDMIDVFAFPPTLKGTLVYAVARAKFGLEAVRDRLSRTAGS